MVGKCSLSFDCSHLCLLLLCAAIVVNPSSAVLHHSCVHNAIISTPLKNLGFANVSYLEEPKRQLREVAGGKASRIEKRNLKIHLIPMLNESCFSVGQSSPTYVTEGDSIECSTADLLTPSKYSFILAAAKNATQRLSLSLLSTPIEAISVPSRACKGFSVTAFDVYDADFVLFLTAASMVEAGQTIAWGRPCLRESSTGAGRPVVGHINFVPSQIPTEGPILEKSVVITMHEISHALGFTDLYSTLSSYVGLDGTRQESGGTFTVYRPGLRKNVQLVRTPRVLAAARKHFGCDTLDGVEIEDMGGSGTAGSHWKKRIFYEEALVGVVSSASLYYSSVTLAFFEDAGFYQPNYYFAQDHYRWGYSKGCEFLTKSCRSLYDSGNYSEEFCFQATSSTQPYCTHDRNSVGYCDLAAFSNPLPTEYQYFSNPRKGGSLSTMDYCPAVLDYDNFNCVNPYAFPLVNIYGNSFGPGSRCFDSNVISHTIPLLRHSPHCFSSSCVSHPDGSNQQLVLSVQSQTVPCPIDGSEGEGSTEGLRGLHGAIHCPQATDVCSVNSMASNQVIEGVVPTENPLVPKYLENFSVTHPRTVDSTCHSRARSCEAFHAAGSKLFCQSVLTRMINCFGVHCFEALKSSIEDMFGIQRSSCWLKEMSVLVPLCLDGVDGANSICSLLSS